MFDALRKRLADRNVGLLAEFSDPGALMHAVENLRKRGYSRLDTFTPFPVHGMDRAMGLGPSKLGYMVFIGGLTGCALGYFLQWWTSAGSQPDWLMTPFQGYPINISNKPLFAIEPSVPIMFELTVLFAALTAVAGMLALNGLPRPYNPLFHSERIGRASDDGFFLHIEASDSQFDRDATAAALAEEGALAIEYLDHDGAESIDLTTAA
ncbi:MAG: DUF3341 domain-containing protein [Rhodothermaceae bacterium]|nr:DUF3341 domain-containing protein [Rhodothermaceae bacterium]